MAMPLLNKSYLAALAAVFFFSLTVQAAEIAFIDPADLLADTLPSPVDAQAAFERLSLLPAQDLTKIKGQRIALEIDLKSSPGFSLETLGNRQEARYRMAFNNIAEGWSWQPLADPQQEDYYRAKFLPLKSVQVERSAYDHQDKIGETQRMKITWRYDYFLAFDNLYDFYPRGVDDDAGFVAALPLALPEQAASEVRMLAVARLSDPLFSESTTFWKATHGQPTDFTLKKRYLHAQLEMILFADKKDGRILGRMARR
jgi:hypothetical protein